MAGNLKRTKRKPPGAPPSIPPPSASDDAPKFFELPPTEADGEALTIKIAEITANPFNDRDLGDLTHLAESIDKDGLLQDVVVMHTSTFADYYPDSAEGIETKYVLAFGERRWRATQLAGAEQISAILRNDIAPKIRRVLFVENFHRKQLSPIEEARKFQRMHEEEGMSYREIVDELSLGGPNHVSRRLELLKLPAELQSIVGTEDGPGVTLARNIMAQLAEPEEQVLAWRLIRDDNLTLKEAVGRIHGGEAVPLGNGVPVPRTEENAEEQQPSISPETPEVAVATSTDNETKTKRPGSDDQSGSAGKRLEAAKPKPTKSKSSVTDKDTVQRNKASAGRDAACQDLIRSDTELTSEQRNALYARTLLIPIQQGPARARAHKWLREADLAEFTISDTDSYFEAVLSSGNTELINRATFATALAASETRARDGRRQWDRTDAEHVRLLVDAANYHPQTEWECSQLKKFGISLPGADEDPDAESPN